MRVLKILLFIGTRPELVKMAPVAKELLSRPGEFATRIVFTAQHRELLDQMGKYFGVSADRDLDIMRPNQDLNELTARMLPRIAEAVREAQPDAVLAQGDTTTVFATALACFNQGVTFGHVEAGLRSGDLHDPFPEEANRRLVGQLADLNFAPTPRDAEALRAEGVPCESIFVTGNTVIDALLETAARSPDAPEVVPNGAPLVLVTIHRRESFGAKLVGVLEAIREAARARPDYRFVFPVHPNPRVRGPARQVLGEEANVLLLEPLAYGEFVGVMQRASLIVTDSGGVQEEAPALGVPVLVVRETTERPQAVEAGVARLVGTERERLLAAILQELAPQKSAPESRRAAPQSPFGDGKAAKRIADVLRGYLLNGQTS